MHFVLLYSNIFWILKNILFSNFDIETNNIFLNIYKLILIDGNDFNIKASKIDLDFLPKGYEIFCLLKCVLSKHLKPAQRAPV